MEAEASMKFLALSPQNFWFLLHWNEVSNMNEQQEFLHFKWASVFLSSNSSTVQKVRLRNIRSPCWTVWSPMIPQNPPLLPPFCDTDQRLPVAWLTAGTWPTGCQHNQPTNLRRQWSMRWMNPCRLSSDDETCVTCVILCLWFLWFSGGSKLPADCVSTMTCLTN